MTTSVVFGLWHIGSTLPPAKAGVSPVLQGAALAGVVVVTGKGGAVLGWLRQRSGSLLAPIGLHLGTNSVACSPPQWRGRGAERVAEFSGRLPAGTALYCMHTCRGNDEQPIRIALAPASSSRPPAGHQLSGTATTTGRRSAAIALLVAAWQQKPVRLLVDGHEHRVAMMFVGTAATSRTDSRPAGAPAWMTASSTCGWSRWTAGRRCCGWCWRCSPLAWAAAA